jgi:serine/threonine protein kinase
MILTSTVLCLTGALCDVVTALLPYAAATPLNTDEMKSLAQWFFAMIGWFRAHGMVHRDIKPANILVIRTQHGLEFKVGPSLQPWLIMAG